MVKWPFQGLSDLQLGDKKVNLNHLHIYKSISSHLSKSPNAITPNPKKKLQERATKQLVCFLQLAQNPRFFKNLPPHSQKRFRWTGVPLDLFFSMERLKQSLEMQMAADKKEMDQAKVNQRFVQMSNEKKGPVWWFSVYIGDEKYDPFFLFWGDSKMQFIRIPIKQPVFHGKLTVGVLFLLMAGTPIFWGIKLDANICQQYKSGGTKPTKIGYMNHFRRVHSSSRFWGDQSWSLKSVVILRDFPLHKVVLVPVGVIFHDPGLKKAGNFRFAYRKLEVFLFFFYVFFFHTF